MRRLGGLHRWASCADDTVEQTKPEAEASPEQLDVSLSDSSDKMKVESAEAALNPRFSDVGQHIGSGAPKASIAAEIDYDDDLDFDF